MKIETVIKVFNLIGILFFFGGFLLWFLLAIIVVPGSEPETATIFGYKLATTFQIYSLAPMLIGLGINEMTKEVNTKR